MQKLNWNQFCNEFTHSISALVPFDGMVSYQIDSPVNGSAYLFAGEITQSMDEYLNEMQIFDPLHFRHFYNHAQIKLKILSKTTLNHEFKNFVEKFQVIDSVDLFFRHEGIPVYGMALVRTNKYTVFSNQELKVLESFYDITSTCLEQIHRTQQITLFSHEEFNHYQLTKKEMQIIEILCRGLNNKDIAQETYCSVPTIKTHLQHIYKKLGVKSRQQLISRFMQEHSDTSYSI